MYNVFIVDDEPFIIEGLYDIANWDELGLEIVGQAYQGEEALAKLKQVPADILITDISMPVMNGLELIRQARKVLPDLLVVVLSGYDEFAYVKEGLSLGIENYLLKPINIKEFRDTLMAVTEKLNATRESDRLRRYSAQILKENVLNRWIHNQISPEELKERAALFSLPVDKRFVQAAILHPEAPGEADISFVSSTLDSCGQAIVFLNMNGDAVLLVTGDDPVRLAEETEERLALLQGGLPEDAQVRIMVGSVEPAGDGAAASYAHARRMQEYAMIYPERRVLRYEVLQSRQAPFAERLPEDWGECAKLVLAKDRTGLIQRIGDYFAALKDMPGITPQALQDAAVEWMVFLKIQVQEIRHEAAPDFFAESLERLRAASSIGSLTETLKQAAAEALEFLERDVKSPVLQLVLNHVHTSYHEEMSLKTLGAMYNIHPVYLGQLFHKEVGVSFTEYVNRYRIEKAKEQLRTTNQKIQEIARNAGYWEIAYFYKQFKKYVGVTPSEFKGLL